MPLTDDEARIEWEKKLAKDDPRRLDPSTDRGSEQAFPSTELRSRGLTKREYFAGQAMIGIIAAGLGPKGILDADEEDIAEVSVKMADALIGALNE